MEHASPNHNFGGIDLSPRQNMQALAPDKVLQIPGEPQVIGFEALYVLAVTADLR
jgi:hypothetical protein